MCELFGYSSSTARLLARPLGWFQARGGEAADNRDGWGIAWRSAERMRVHKEPVAAAGSEAYGRLAAWLESDLVIGHVRKANPPTAHVSANTHPFQRDCCGRTWVFAHNGVVPGASAPLHGSGAGICAQPLGDTDSEHAFCHVLERIAAAFRAPHAEGKRAWLGTLAGTAEMLAAGGRFNFLMSDGVHLIAFGHDRLHSLDAAGAALVATEPLTANPEWQPFAAGELRVYRAGRRVARLLTHAHGAATQTAVRQDAA